MAVLVGFAWVFKLELVLSILPTFESMKFNTALLFLVSSVILAIQTYPNTKRVTFVLTFFLGSFSLLTLLQYLLQIDLHIDELFIKDYLAVNKSPYPGRMALITAVSFTLFSIAIVTRLSSTETWKRVSQLAINAIMLLALIAIVGYLTNVTKLHQLAGFTSVAIHTAILFLLLTLGAELLDPNRGYSSIFLRKFAGSIMARRIFLPYVVILFSLSPVIIWLYRSQFITPEYAIGLFTIAMLFAGIGLISNAALNVNRIEAEREQAEANAIHKAEDIQNMISAIKDGFFALDFNLNFILVSPVFSEIARMNADSMIGKNLLDIFPHMKDGDLIARYRRALNTNLASKFLHTNSLDPNQFFEISVYPNKSGLFVFFRDITEAKQAEKEINELNNTLRLINQELETKVELRTTELNRINKDLEALTKKLHEHNDKLKNYIHIISHNLRSHSVNLHYLIRYLKEENDKETHASLMNKLEEVISNLTETLDTLVETVKIQDNQDAELELVSFDAILNTIKTILSSDIEKNEAVISSNFNEAPYVIYPKAYLESILLNLISNALRYKSNNRPPIISLKSFKNAEGIYLQISDNGSGMDLDRYGDKLFGLNKTFHRHPEAKGVGLFMVKNQVEAMGGKITVQSQIEKGTTFTIFLTSKS